MSYKVIVDSCGEFTPEMKADGGFEHVALGIQIEDTQWTDDDSLKQEELLLKIAESTSCAKTSCPSPERYMESYHCDAERIYVVTLSAELSGSYNSAVLGKNLYEEAVNLKRCGKLGKRIPGRPILVCPQKDRAGFGGPTAYDVAFAKAGHTVDQHHPGFGGTSLFNGLHGADELAVILCLYEHFAHDVSSHAMPLLMKISR